MKRFSVVIAILALSAFGAAGIVQAHECDYSESDGTSENMEKGEQSNCSETKVQPNWRDGNYVPLFDLEDRDDTAQRRDAQRWRDCSYYDEDGVYQNNQFCVWLDFGNSIDDSPNEVHAGSGGQHCFLGEFAHDCSDHDRNRGEGVHDAHGGSVYVDVCAGESAESRYCDDGLADTQAGIVVMDHNPCGAIVPIVACTDEYHVLRPFDEGYTEEQMADSAEYIERIAGDPMVYLCGKPGYPDYGFPPCSTGGADVSPVPVSDLDDATRALLGRLAALSGGSASDALARARQDSTQLLASFEPARAASPLRDGSAWGALVLALLAIAVRARRLVLSR